MKIDPYQHELKYKKWQEKTINGIPGISKDNSDIILQYLYDMEHGLNVAKGSVKGGRSYIRLHTLKERLVFLAKQVNTMYGIENMMQISEEQLVLFFSRMKKGDIKKKNGSVYISVDSYAKAFKAFWHWYQTVNRKKGIDIPDITVDLETRGNKPRWVYLTEDEIRKLCEHAKPNYKALIMFMYDTGIRSPTELVNIRVSDLYDNCTKVNIRDEIVKIGSFGRKINLMLCSDIIRNHIRDHQLNYHDQLFAISPPVVNRYLKRLAQRVLGNDVTLAGQRYSDLTMYDFRHCSCCYWLPRYKSESALKYRFGWRQSDKIHYYSELLGMKNTITEEDLLLDLSKTEIERKLLKSEQENKVLQEKMNSCNQEIQKVKILLKKYVAMLKQLESGSVTH